MVDNTATRINSYLNHHKVVSATINDSISVYLWIVSAYKSQNVRFGNTSGILQVHLRMQSQSELPALSINCMSTRLAVSLALRPSSWLSSLNHDLGWYDDLLTFLGFLLAFILDLVYVPILYRPAARIQTVLELQFEKRQSNHYRLDIQSE
jgi:hypothetical protein